MSEATKTHLSCDFCGSSDAKAEYDDGHTYCFSCGRYEDGEKEFMSEGYTYQYLEDYRGLRRETLSFFGVKAKINGDGNPTALGYPYTGDSIHVRTLKEKGFYWTGTSKPGVWGRNKFAPGSAKAITITEGENDAMAVYQMQGSKYPCVSVRSSTTARADCTADFEYLNSFESIYICFDGDKPGQDRVPEVAGLFDVNKVYIVRLERYKDAHEYLERGADREFISTWWSARKYLPKGVISDYRDVEEILSKERVLARGSYPFPTVQSMSYGIRPAEVVLLTAQEGVGKTEFLRAIEYHLLKETDDNIAIIHLEEEEKRSVQGLVGYHLSLPAHLPDSGLSVEDQVSAFKQLTKKDGRCHFYTHFGSNDPDTILDIIRYLAAVCGCKFITLDHITMIVTGHEGDDERKKLDYISTRLAVLTRELGFTLFLVSHVNDEGKTRGSRNISKVADLWIELSRDTDAGAPSTSLRIKKNRFTGKTGPAGTLIFNPDSFTLTEQVIADVDFNPEITEAERMVGSKIFYDRSMGDSQSTSGSSVHITEPGELV